MTAAQRCPVVHLELHTGDFPRARAITPGSSVGARMVTTRSGTYFALELGELGGGIVECETPRTGRLAQCGQHAGRWRYRALAT